MVLNYLPKTLDETYRTLLGIDEEKRLSFRSFRHGVDGLAEILAIRFDEEAFPTIYTDWNPESRVCSSLIATADRGGHHVVQFSHFSARSRSIDIGATRVG